MTILLKKWLLMVYALLAAPTLLAQNNGWLRGTINDEQRRPLESATVILLPLHGTVALKTTPTDSAGRFSINNIPYGLFTCKITYTGYQPIIKDSVKLTPTSSTVNLGSLTMVPSGNVLAELTVSAKPPTLRNGPDKKVFAVNQSLVSVGGSAADLLQNVPTLQLDASGNLSLRGATDIAVLVDGKRSTIGGGTVAQILQSIPASSIDKIEVITNPSAKYDAGGQAIVNIVLKKNNAAGFNSSVAATGGTRDNYNAAAAVSYQDKRLNLYANYSYQHKNTYSNGYQNMTYLPAEDNVYYSNETFPSVTVRDIHSARAGLDYNFSAKDVLSLSAVLNATKRVRNEWLTVDNLTAQSTPAQLSTRYNYENGNTNSYELTLDYTHSFSKPQQQLSFDVDYAPGNASGVQFYNSNIYNINGTTTDSTSVTKDTKTERSTDYNAQVDYTTPIGKTIRLEAGLRSQIQVTNNQEWDYNLDQKSGAYDPDYGFINFFKSTNQVHAAYINFHKQINTFALQVGLRGELGRFSGHLQSYDSAGQLVPQPITVNTKGLYPSLQLTDRIDANRQLQLNYSRRILRPTTSELDPFFDISDPVNYNQGNPYLLPESIHSAEFTFTRTWPKATLTSGAYFTLVNDVIKHVQAVPVDAVTITIAENLKQAINTGLEFIGDVHPIKPWDFTANLNIYERINAGDSAFGITATHGVSWNVNLTNNFTLAPNLTLQLRADYAAPELILQDRYRRLWGIDAAAKYDFWHKKASLSINGRDIFDTRKWRFYRVSDAVLLNFQRISYSDRGSITFTYRFGGSASSSARKVREEQQNLRVENR